jgi:hypothetical protein
MPSTGAIGETWYYVMVTNTNNNVSGIKTSSVASIAVKISVSDVINAATPTITGQPENAN